MRLLPSSSTRRLAMSTALAAAVLSTSACSDDASSATLAADTATSSGSTPPSSASAEPTATAIPPSALRTARWVVRRINAEDPAAARRLATRAAVRRMVDLHQQGFDFVRPPRCRVDGDSRLCRSDLVVESGGGTTCNLRVRLVEDRWRVTGVAGLD